MRVAQIQYRPNNLAPSTTVRPMLITRVTMADEQLRAAGSDRDGADRADLLLRVRGLASLGAYNLRVALVSFCIGADRNSRGGAEDLQAVKNRPGLPRHVPCSYHRGNRGAHAPEDVLASKPLEHAAQVRGTEEVAGMVDDVPGDHDLVVVNDLPPQQARIVASQSALTRFSRGQDALHHQSQSVAGLPAGARELHHVGGHRPRIHCAELPLGGVQLGLALGELLREVRRDNAGEVCDMHLHVVRDDPLADVDHGPVLGLLEEASQVVQL